MTTFPENAMPVDWACGPGTFSAGLTTEAIKLCKQLHASLEESAARNTELLAIVDKQQDLLTELAAQRTDLAQKLNSQQAQVQALLAGLVKQSREHLETFRPETVEYQTATAHLAAWQHVHYCLFGTYEVPA